MQRKEEEKERVFRSNTAVAQASCLLFFGFQETRLQAGSLRYES